MSSGLRMLFIAISTTAKRDTGREKERKISIDVLYSKKSNATWNYAADQRKIMKRRNWSRSHKLWTSFEGWENVKHLMCVCVCDSFKPHSSGILISNSHPEIGFASLESGFSPNQQLRNNLREFLRQMIIYTQVTVRFLAVFSASFFCFTDCPSPAHSYKLLIVFFPTPSSMGNVQVHSESTDCIFFFQLASRFIDLDQVEVSWAKMSFSSADWNTRGCWLSSMTFGTARSAQRMWRFNVEVSWAGKARHAAQLFSTLIVKRNFFFWSSKLAY